MATRYQDISYGSFGGGIDQLSPESKIPDDYVQLLDNIDPTPNGSLAKRKGTQLYGSLPVRVERLEYERVGISAPYTGELCLFLDTSVDVLSLRSTPIYVYGRTSKAHAAGDFTDELEGKYYPSFRTEIKQPVYESDDITPQTSQITLEGNTHDQGALLSVNLYRSLSGTNLSSEWLLAADYRIEKTTANITADVTTGLVSDLSTIAFESFIVAKGRATSPGSSYVHTSTVMAASQYPNVVPVTITASTHNLSSFNILVDCYVDTGTEYERIIPNQYTITPDGSVVLEFAHYQNFNLVACLYAVPAAQSKAQLVEENEINETIVFDYPDSPFLFFQLLEEKNDGSRVSILGSTVPNVPNNQQSSSLTTELLGNGGSDYRVTFYVSNQAGSNFTATVLWDYGRLVSNKLCLDASDPVTDNYQLVIPGLEHGLGEVVSTVVLQSTNPTNENNLLIQYDTVETSIATDDVTVSIQNNTTSQLEVYATLADRSVANGAYHTPVTTVTANAVNTISVTGATHGKGTSINVCLFQVTGTQYLELQPSGVTIDSTNGDVTVTIDNTGNAAFDAIVVIYSVTNTATIPSPIAAATLVSPGPPAVYTPTVGIFTISGLTSSFAFIQVYELSGTNKIRITPDRVSVNSVLGTATIQITNSNTTTLNVAAYWDYADYSTQESVPVVGSGGRGYTDLNPQMTIWGLPHRQLYSGATGTTPGYVTHIDTYRAQAEERAVAGLGGNLFEIVEYAEANAELGLSQYYPNLRARVSDPVIIGPAFVDVNGPEDRTQGVLKFIQTTANQASVTSASYVSGSQVTYRLYMPQDVVNPGQGPIIIGSLNQIFNPSEFLSLQNMGYSVHNGDFQVVSASLVAGTDYVDATVINPNVDSSDWNETGSDGRAGIFTDRIPLEVICPFFENDRLLSASWGDEQLLTVTGTSAGLEVRMDGLYTNVSVPDGLLLVGARTSRIVPLRSINAIPTTEDLVAGDILSFSGLSRELRAKFVNPRADETGVSISPNSQSAVIKPIRVNVANSDFFQVGQRILLLNAGVFTGEQVVSAINSPTQIEVEGDQYIPTAILGAVIVGYNVEVDEEFDWYDSLTSTVAFTTARRWVPIEQPDSGYAQVPANRYRYFNSESYDNQPFLRSTMVQDTMYLTNGLDAVQRYDGRNLTRAGFFRWQANAYLTADTSVASIVPNTYQVDDAKIKNIGTNFFEVNKYLDKHFAAGETIRYTNVTSGVTTVRDLTIVKTWEGNTESFIEVDTAGVNLLTGGTKTLNKISLYSYYYRLNLIDANNNRIASAVTGAQDARVEITQSATIRHLLIRPPFLDNFDYARVEIEIYRTKAGLSAPYYLVGVVKPNWNQSGDAYIEFVDTKNDSVLRDVDQDVVMVALLGQELGQTWTGPLRSKYVTSASNSLVLANFKTWPTLTLQPVKVSSSSTPTVSDFVGRKMLLKKDFRETGTTTDNINRMNFEFLNNGAHTIVPANITIDYDTNELEIPSTGHGLVEGNWIYLFYSDTTTANVANVDPRLGGHYQVSSVPGANAFRIQVSNELIESVTLAALNGQDVNRYVHATNQNDIPVWLGFDRLYGTKAGRAQLSLEPLTYLFLRLANAINSAQAACSTANFTPWIVANAGGEYANNELVLEVPYVSDLLFSISIPAFSDVNLFANGIRADAGSPAIARVQLFPSRLLVSYPNYPEIFDAPSAFLDTDSESAIDINPSDGQEITGVIPFFGDSAFGAAQKDGILLVFKTASVYLVNLNAKRAGQPCVQRLDTRGLGCTAPFSIAPTQNGIMFANQSGIYRITTSLQCQYIGRRVERIWKEEVDTTTLDLTAHGHYYPLGHQYKLSIPYREDGESYSQRVLVYNTVREYTADGYRDGSWTSYSNLPAIGWANMLERALFATPNGEVFTLRMTGDSTDYRDDGAPISAMATLRALDFGTANIRKAVGSFTVQFRPEDRDSNVVVEAAIDLIDNWEELDPAVVSRQRRVGNINNRSIQQLAVIQYMSNKRKGVFYQLRISNDQLDQGLQVNGVDVAVAGIGGEGIIQARETGSR